MIGLWRDKNKVDEPIVHEDIPVVDIEDITYKSMLIYHKEWSSVVDAFNQCCNEVARPLRKYKQKDGLHIYLRNHHEYHIYPGEDSQIKVIRIHGDLSECYLAECPELHQWFVRHS